MWLQNLHNLLCQQLTTAHMRGSQAMHQMAQWLDAGQQHTTPKLPRTERVCVLGLQVPKSGLMSFGDCAHDEDKHLRVLFLWHGRPHAATLADQVLSPTYVLQNPARVASREVVLLHAERTVSFGCACAA